MPKLKGFIQKQFAKYIEECSKQHYYFLVFCIDNHIDLTKLDLSDFEKYMELVNMYMKGDNIQ